MHTQRNLLWLKQKFVGILQIIHIISVRSRQRPGHELLSVTCDNMQVGDFQNSPHNLENLGSLRNNGKILLSYRGHLSSYLVISGPKFKDIIPD